MPRSSCAAGASRTRNPGSRCSTASTRATRSCSSGRWRTWRSASAWRSRARGSTTRASARRSRCATRGRWRRPARRRCAAYLRRVKHVGAARAAQLLERHGEAVLEAIDADPRGAFARARALAEAGATRRCSSWDGLRATRQLHLLLAPHGLTWLVWRVHKHYGDARAPHRARAPVRADEPVRRRLPHGRPDRPRRRRGRRQSRSAPAPPCCTRSARPSARARPACPSPELARAVAGLLDGHAADGRAARRDGRPRRPRHRGRRRRGRLVLPPRPRGRSRPSSRTASSPSSTQGPRRP